MKRIALLLAAIALSGCAHDQNVRQKNDRYDHYYDTITIYNSPTLTDAQTKANRYCNAVAYEIPELRAMDLKRLQAEKGYNIVDPAAYHFKCSKMEALRIRGSFGDAPSKAEYDRLSKIESDKQAEKNLIEYEKEREQLKRAARAPGISTVTKKNFDGSYSTTSYGNGIICESTVGETGGSSSCTDVDDY
ncbi:hypothetical protein [Enterobacter cancerogenus]|uniref:Lipoprotein n=1 Tax=Enterobacter cancerogenus TaxID=69218 RepID=A0A484WUG2_9ENTR|nr:Uncharacterised protein [Enterobacter cancerogenus]